ncbi:MAG: hypothetical protein ACO1N9_01320 [Flavobacterium sp.]
MKLYFVFIFLIFFSKIYSQNCSTFTNGIYKIEIFDEIFIIEKYGKYQLERNANIGIHLHKVERNGDDCSFIVKKYKVIDEGTSFEHDKNAKINIEIYKVEDNKFYYKSTLIGTQMTIDAIMVKQSDNISSYFEDLLKDEKVK